MDFGLKNKTVLVTGASRGIGRATAIAYAKEGARVIVHYKQNKNAALETLKQLQGEGHFIIESDISIPENAERLIVECFSKTGHIDILVNNAGVYMPEKIENLDFDLWQKIWDKTTALNITAAGNLSFLAAKKMIEGKIRGKIINVSSRGAFRGEPEAIAYGASKAALNALGQSMAQALGKYGIGVYTVAPGFVGTEMSDYIMKTPEGAKINAQSPLNRIAKPEEVADTIVFLSSGNSEFLTGGIIDVNGASYLRS